MPKRGQTVRPGKYTAPEVVSASGQVLALLARSGIALRSGTGEGKRFKTGKKGEPLFRQIQSLRYLLSEGKIGRVK